ncbi:RAMP superfamily CRISPR-associated protein [Dolichospermum sp. ST_sed9]|nr:RAMP superfamily CRISPR-associated protein [Dolichospermum sp. ST_sed9]
MSEYLIKIELLSDTTFGRGDGVAGLVDQEVEHDNHGFPYLRGRTLKGLLREECDNLVRFLSDDWKKLANTLFGVSGSELGTMAKIHIGNACLPEDLRQAVALQFEQKTYKGEKVVTNTDILSSLTTIRRQTAINPKNGATKEKSLRSSRVILRELCFTAPVIFNIQTPEVIQKMLTLLAPTTLALRRIGDGRNRGRGHVKCTLWETSIEHNKENEITQTYLKHFEQETKA